MYLDRASASAGLLFRIFMALGAISFQLLRRAVKGAFGPYLGLLGPIAIQLMICEDRGVKKEMDLRLF